MQTLVNGWSMVSIGVLAQLDVGGFLVGPEGRGIAANLVSSLLLGLLNAIIGIFFNAGA